MRETFPFEPAGAGPVLFFGGLLLFLGLLLAALGSFSWASKRGVVELDEGGLRIRADLYGRRIPWSSIRADGVSVVDLSGNGTWKVTARTNGAGLPGYLSGWFRMSGGDKALLFVTRKDAVVRVPTTDGYSLFVSVKEPARFAEAVKRGAGG